MRWPLRNFPAGPMPDDNDIYQEEASPTCPPLDKCNIVAEEELRTMEDEIKKLRKDEKKLKKEVDEDDNEIKKLESKLCKAYNKCPKTWHGLPLRGCSKGKMTI